MYPFAKSEKKEQASPQSPSKMPTFRLSQATHQKRDQRIVSSNAMVLFFYKRHKSRYSVIFSNSMLRSRVLGYLARKVRFEGTELARIARHDSALVAHVAGQCFRAAVTTLAPWAIKSPAS